jgi:tetratricopeptide (TPR) repeat protein
VTFSLALEFDIQDIEKNLKSNDINNRLILVKHYLDNNDLEKAKKYNSEVLEMAPENIKANSFSKKIGLKEEFYSILNKNSVSDEDINKLYKDLYKDKKYSSIKDKSKYLDFMNTDYPKIITAKIFTQEGNYNKSENILDLVKDKRDIEFTKVKAYNCFNLNDYICARDNFKTLYDFTYDLDYGHKLVNTYIILGDMKNANVLNSKILALHPNDKKSQNYKKSIDKLLNAIKINYKKIYEESNSFSDLQNLVSVLLNDKKEDEAYVLLEDYIKENPKDNNAKFWYATYLSWGNKNDKALEVLEPIISKGSYKEKLLAGKILSWNNDFDSSINYLNDVIVNSKSGNLVIDSKEAKGLVYYWKKDYKTAKSILKDVLKHKNSVEAAEAIMVMEGNVKPLVKKYTLLHKQDPLNLEYIFKIAQYSEILKDENNAIKYYEKYYAIDPTPQVARFLAKLYLYRGDYYKGFGYYEYWTYKTNTDKSFLELANTYFNYKYYKAALDVLEEMLKRYPDHKEALDLKAKISKIKPKYMKYFEKGVEKVVSVNDIESFKAFLKSKSLIVLKFADKLYFNGFHIQANEYYKKYILDNPRDYFIRDRYAHSLEFAGQYDQASAEFFLLLAKKKDCNTLYHYAYNLEQLGKREEAAKYYEEAQKLALKPLPKNLESFVYKWKEAWESQKIDKYKLFYAPKNYNDKNWLKRKASSLTSVKFIQIGIQGASLVSQTKNTKYETYIVKFYQNYKTDKLRDKGYKTLEINCLDEKCFIAKESWAKGQFNELEEKCYSLAKERWNIVTEVLPNMQDLIREYKENNNTNEIEIIFDKNVTDEKEVLNRMEVNLTNKFELKKNTILVADIKQKVGLKGEYYEDKTDIRFTSYGPYYKYQFNAENSYYVDVQKWKLWQNEQKRNGKFLTFKAKNGAWTFGGEAGSYEGYSYIYPYIEYNDYFTYIFSQAVTGKEKKSFCAVDDHLNSLNFSISKYQGAYVKSKKEMTDYWGSLGFSQISNGNFSITPQFQYRFNREDEIFKDTTYVYYYLSGWYTSNSKQDADCYYSPDLYDSTFLEVHPVYNNLELIGKAGYSAIENTFLYSYGFDYQYNDNVSLNCMKNHSFRDNVSDYWYLECKLDIGVQW